MYLEGEGRRDGDVLRTRLGIQGKLNTLPDTGLGALDVL